MNFIYVFELQCRRIADGIGVDNIITWTNEYFHITGNLFVHQRIQIAVSDRDYLLAHTLYLSIWDHRVYIFELQCRHIAVGIGVDRMHHPNFLRR